MLQIRNGNSSLDLVEQNEFKYEQMQMCTGKMNYSFFEIKIFYIIGHGNRDHETSSNRGRLERITT